MGAKNMFIYFLVENGFSDAATFHQADIIYKNKYGTSYDENNVLSHRRMGEILLYNFHVFNDHPEMEEKLVEFEEYREKMKKLYIELSEMFGTCNDNP
jgi:hypothetical protein